MKHRIIHWRILIIFIASITGITCEKSDLTEYGPWFPFKIAHQSVMAMENWEISRVRYEYSLNARDIFFLNNDTGFLLGNSGLIFKTTDSGNSWIKIESETGLNLVSVFFLNEKTGFASSEGPDCPYRNCSKGSLLLKTTDCGETWTQHLFPDYYRILSLKFFDESRGIALIYTRAKQDSLKANIATTSDGGSSWKLANLELIRGIERLTWAEDYIFAQGTEKRLYRSHDHGITWDTLFLPGNQFDYVTAMYFPDENTGFYGNNETGFYKTTDSGDSWTKIQFISFGTVHFYNVQEGFNISGVVQLTNSGPVSEGSLYYFTKDGGLTWKKGELKESVNINHTHFPYPDSGFGFQGSAFYKYFRKSD